MLRIGVAAHDLHVTTDARCRGIPLLILSRSAVNLLQLRVVDVRSECALYGVKVCPVTVCSDLDSIADALSAVVHKLRRPTGVTSADQVTYTDLGVGINCRPGPRIAPPFGLLL